MRAIGEAVFIARPPPTAATSARSGPSSASSADYEIAVVIGTVPALNEMDQLLLAGPPNVACEARELHPVGLAQASRMRDDVPREKASVVFKGIAGFGFNKPATQLAVGERFIGVVSRYDEVIIATQNQGLRP